jgi:hypothetical protein
VLGLVALLGSACFLAERWSSDWFTRGDKTIQQVLVTSDGSAKATLYRIDFGAAAATRTYVALSSPKVDGSTKGFVVLTLLHCESPGRPALEWKADRLLVVHYPGQAEVEYGVSKTRGITIELAPE